MKTTKFLSFILATTLLFASCTDLLELYPLDMVSTGTFWKTESDFDNALTACYCSMQHEYFAHGMGYWDNLTDNGYGQHNYGSSTNIAQGNIATNTGGFISGIFNQSYSSIARVNIYLSKLKEFDGMNSAKKIQNEAEARMLRAFFYSYLYRCYGDVPLVDEPLNLENQFVAKSPATEILNFFMSDLDFAIQNLPNVTYKESTGRWTSNAAKAYKARMLLYDAYDTNKNAIASKMQEALGLLNQISGYKLADDYSANFHDLEQEDCPEIIMSVKFLAPVNRTSADQWYSDWVVTSPLPNLISLYEMADGSPGEPVPYTGRGAIDQTLCNNATLLEREPRCAKTIFINRYKDANGNEYTPDNNRPLGSGLQKFLSPNLTMPYGYVANSQQDWVIMRYADVLLMIAEAENELNGPSDAVYKAINDIRLRGGAFALPDGLTKDEMRERIRRERRIEMAFEGQRYFDLKRWKIAKEVLNAVVDGLIVYNFEDRHYLWPLPQTEIDKANGVLVQNPDYK